MSALPPVFSFPSLVRDADPPSNGPPQASPATDNPQDLENPSRRPVRHQVVRHVSSPSHTALQSPLRHHQRTASVGRPPIRETLNACVTYDEEEDGVQGIRINQYVTFAGLPVAVLMFQQVYNQARNRPRFFRRSSLGGGSGRTTICTISTPVKLRSAFSCSKLLKRRFRQ